jgi:methylmalonyl-CoA/ethylmalonyl-CoA epimerase
LELPLDHVALAVPSIESALPTYELLTGGRGSPPENIPGDNVRVAFVGGPACRIELVEPTTPESSVARFIARRGPGLHHIAFRVANLDEALRKLVVSGVELVDRTPRVGSHGRRVAFIHPRSTHGVLVELIEP